MALPFSDSYDCNTAHTSESGSYEGVMIPVITEFSQKLHEKKIISARMLSTSMFLENHFDHIFTCLPS